MLCVAMTIGPYGSRGEMASLVSRLLAGSVFGDQVVK